MNFCTNILLEFYYFSICKKFDLIRDAFSLNLQINTHISIQNVILHKNQCNKTIK